MLNFTEEQLQAASDEAEGAVERLMEAVPDDERTPAFGLLLTTVTASVFESQCLARTAGIPPEVWLEYYLSVTATAIMQFNYDCLYATHSKNEIAAATLKSAMRLGEYIAEAARRMLHNAPDVPARPLNS